eukprot:5145435-Prymnesium_polylepis.2
MSKGGEVTGWGEGEGWCARLGARVRVGLRARAAHFEYGLVEAGARHALGQADRKHAMVGVARAANDEGAQHAVKDCLLAGWQGHHTRWHPTPHATTRDYPYLGRVRAHREIDLAAAKRARLHRNVDRLPDHDHRVAVVAPRDQRPALVDHHRRAVRLPQDVDARAAVVDVLLVLRPPLGEVFTCGRARAIAELAFSSSHAAALSG